MNGEKDILKIFFKKANNVVLFLFAIVSFFLGGLERNDWQDKKWDWWMADGVKRFSKPQCCNVQSSLNRLVRRDRGWTDRKSVV